MAVKVDIKTYPKKPPEARTEADLEAMVTDPEGRFDGTRPMVVLRADGKYDIALGGVTVVKDTYLDDGITVVQHDITYTAAARGVVKQGLDRAWTRVTTPPKAETETKAEPVRSGARTTEEARNAIWVARYQKTGSHPSA